MLTQERASRNPNWILDDALTLPHHAGVTLNVCQPFYSDPIIMGSKSMNPLRISPSPYSHTTQAEEPSHQELFTVAQNEQNDVIPSVPPEEEQSLPM